MSQNRSYAVMAQRAEARDSLDDFPTPPWGTRALCEHVIKPRCERGVGLGAAWDPACNRGFMVRPLQEYFEDVLASDVHDYGFGFKVEDFLFPGNGDTRPEWIITNPPFRLAEQFIERARTIATVGVAVLVRTAFLEGIGRYERQFSINPPTIVAQFVERLPMVKGRADKGANSATAYCWLVWMHGHDPQPMFWIPPCRARLEREGDYDAMDTGAPSGVRDTLELR